MRQRARTDAGHKAIVHALRQVGCQVLDLSRVGSGCPDIAVRAPGAKNVKVWFGGTDPMLDGVFGPRVLLMEIKEPKGKLTPDQEDFLRDWPETVIVRSVQEALEAVGCK